MMAFIPDEKNDIEFIMLYRKPWKLIVYSPTNNYSDEILQFAANEIYNALKEQHTHVQDNPKCEPYDIPRSTF